jgi:cobalt-zinc-cadmium efflux system outer membrane protein
VSAAAIQARLQAERAAEKAKYEAAVATLKRATGRKELRSQHERVEDFFQRGLISSSLVIEAHRQMLEFARSRHEQELTAIRALWRIRAIDGDVLGGSL